MDEKQQNKKKYEALRDELISYIKKNNLKQNDQLPTIRELIDTIGYSYATVHRTLIEMEKEGFITKRQGKGLFVNMDPSAPNNKQVALIIPKDFSAHKIFIDILTGVRKALEKANIGLLVSISNMNHEKEKETINRLITNRVDGMIIFLENHYVNDYSHIAQLKERKYPFVLIDRYIPELETDYVVINNVDAMMRVCSYLKYNRDCDKVLFVTSYEDSDVISSCSEKIEGYKYSMKVLYNDNSAEPISFSELAESIDTLSATYNNVGICVNHDALIVELQKKLQEKGGDIPQNCHVFGYNNSYVTPLFPTVEQFNDQVGMKAAEILIEKMKDPDKPAVKLRLEPKLLIPNCNDGGFSLES